MTSTNMRVIGFSITVLLFIGVIGALGGPVVAGEDVATGDIIPEDGVFQEFSTDILNNIPGINDFTLTVPTPVGLFQTIGNLVDIYSNILAGGGPILQFVTLLMILLLAIPILVVAANLIARLVPDSIL